MPTLKVKSGVYLPPHKGRRGRQRLYPFDTLEIGEMFFVPDKATVQLSSYASTQGKRLGRKFRTQSTTMRQDLLTDEWEPCKPGAVGSRRGVVIERTA